VTGLIPRWEVADARAYRATQAGIKTRFITAADLMMQLATARQQNRLREFFNRVVIGPKLLVIDEISYLPFGREEANLFFNVVAKRYERGAIVLTSNLSFTQAVRLRFLPERLVRARIDRPHKRRRIDQAVADNGVAGEIIFFKVAFLPRIRIGVARDNVVTTSSLHASTAISK